MNAQKRSPATLAEYLKSAQYEFWYPEQTAFVLRHVEQIEAVYRQLLSGKVNPEKSTLKTAAREGVQA